MDYKKYSLENLENWMHDALSCSEASSQEIYDVIKNVVSENYYIYKDHTERCYELLALLNGNGKKVQLDFDVEAIREAGGYEWTPALSNDKVVKWQLPVEVDGASGEYFVQFPDDLLKATNLKEGDQVQWINQGDGSYLLRKV
jgi:hypothetical protein